MALKDVSVSYVVTLVWAMGFSMALFGAGLLFYSFAKASRGAPIFTVSYALVLSGSVLIIIGLSARLLRRAKIG